MSGARSSPGEGATVPGFACDGQLGMRGVAGIAGISTVPPASWCGRASGRREALIDRVLLGEPCVRTITCERCVRTITTSKIAAAIPTTRLSGKWR
jgi:hypothetical protein